MKILDILKDETNGKTKLEELVSAFEKMCKIPIDGVEKEQEMILFETGTYSFADKPLFYFILVRQFPGEEEEYCQIHMDVLYQPDKKNKSFQNTVWDVDIEEDIFEYVKKSQEYLALMSEEILGIDVYLDET